MSAQSRARATASSTRRSKIAPQAAERLPLIPEEHLPDYDGSRTDIYLVLWLIRNPLRADKTLGDVREGLPDLFNNLRNHGVCSFSEKDVDELRGELSRDLELCDLLQRLCHYFTDLDQETRGKLERRIMIWDDPPPGQEECIQAHISDQVFVYETIPGKWQSDVSELLEHNWIGGAGAGLVSRL